MNLKEKLNEVKERSTGIYSFEEEDIVGVDVKLDDYEWLIEQAEQNERYREALEKISQGKITYADSFGMINIARKALEESE